MRLEYSFQLDEVDVPRFSVEAVEGIGKVFTLATLVLNVIDRKPRVELVFHGLNPDDPSRKIDAFKRIIDSAQPGSRGALSRGQRRLGARVLVLLPVAHRGEGREVGRALGEGAAGARPAVAPREAPRHHLGERRAAAAGEGERGAVAREGAPPRRRRDLVGQRRVELREGLDARRLGQRASEAHALEVDELGAGRARGRRGARSCT